jgi:tRNA A37 N6-isopentenylltransferase MiaA
VYKGLDIITNKPSTRGPASSGSRALLSNPNVINSVNFTQTHHLLNKYDPLNPISSTIYAHDARKVIKDILARNKIPVIEGGSPFYIH